MGKDDALRVLRRIAEIWQVDDAWVRWGLEAEVLGFEWWPADFRVYVHAEIPKQGAPAKYIKVVVRTDFLTDVPIDSERFIKLAATTSRWSTSTYAWTHDDRSLLQQFNQPDVSPRWGIRADLLARTAVLQPANAQIQAKPISEILGGSPQISRPKDRDGAAQDEMLEIIA